MTATEAPPATNKQTPTPRTRRIGVDAGHDNYKWWALSCTSLGMLLATINSGTLIIALPDLERSLHTSLLELVWVILVYMIASTVLVLSAGRLSDQFGRKQAYVGGFLIFALASLGAGFAANGTQLILWRILQGIGGSFLFANAAAIVTDSFPKEQLGLAMGTNTMVAAVGLVIGPVLGGALVAISWHWVFWFNVPFGLLGCLWGIVVLHEITGRSEDRRIRSRRHRHVPRSVSPAWCWASPRAGSPGWGSPVVIGGLGAAAVLLPAFVLIERHHRAPMLDLSIFQQPAVLRRRRRRVHQRAGAVRADVRVRLLLPGRPGQLSDPGRGQAGPAGGGDADLLTGGRDLRGPARLPRARRARDDRHRRRAGADDHART